MINDPITVAFIEGFNDFMESEGTGAGNRYFFTGPEEMVSAWSRGFESAKRHVKFCTKEEYPDDPYEIRL